MKLAAFFLLLVWCSLGWSQTNPASGSFKEHSVEAGQTLYAISRLYNVSVDQLISDNPGADKGLNVGQRIRVRVADASACEKGKYVVKAGDTYYGISRNYGISVDELKAMNNGMPAGLIPGDTIVVPESASAVNTSVAVADKDETFDIAVMLPFYTTTKDSLVSRDIRLRDAAVQMYRGIMLAADSLEAMGLNARIRVMDVTDNKNSIHSILKKKEMNGVDLVIGPLFKDLIPEVAAWCATNNAHMVVPVQQPNRVLLNAPALSKSVPGSVTQWMAIARYANKNFDKERVVLVDSKILDDRKLVESFKEEWFKLAKDSLKKVVVCDDVANLKLAQVLPQGKCLVAVPTNDKKVIAAVFKALGTRTDVDVIGLESWDDLEAISTDMRNKFHVSFPKQNFLDPSQPASARWQESYRRKYKTEPIDFSYTGYDVTLFFGSALMTYGANFPAHFSEVKANTIGSEFRFFRTSSGSGFENASINIVRTDNYQLYKVD
jgi:LysM repeat protein/ABC-type branched-subunit amino acid transport system substrate-binding protein